jgi:hypothetical protein
MSVASRASADFDAEAYRDTPHKTNQAGVVSSLKVIQPPVPLQPLDVRLLWHER